MYLLEYTIDNQVEPVVQVIGNHNITHLYGLLTATGKETNLLYCYVYNCATNERIRQWEKDKGHFLDPKL